MKASIVQKKFKTVEQHGFVCTQYFYANLTYKTR